MCSSNSKGVQLSDADWHKFLTDLSERGSDAIVSADKETLKKMVLLGDNNSALMTAIGLTSFGVVMTSFGLALTPVGWMIGAVLAGGAVFGINKLLSGGGKQERVASDKMKALGYVLLVATESGKITKAEGCMIVSAVVSRKITPDRAMQAVMEWQKKK